jgi:putative ABC transport system substrate-binding protein
MRKTNTIGLLLLTALMGLTSCGETTIKVNPDKEHYVVGISQFAVHDALDMATEGFKVTLTEELQKEGRTVEFKENNAQGEISNCTIIANSLVASDVDLIMANATPCLQSAYQATEIIPIIGTSVTEYGTALGISNFDGVVGSNVSGTSDLAPLDQQVQMLFQLVLMHVILQYFLQ